LTPTEFRLLSTLIARPDEVISYQQLARRFWTYKRTAGIERSLKVHASRLRAKLAEGRALAPEIAAVRGHGYMLARQPAYGTAPPSAAA